MANISSAGRAGRRTFADIFMCSLFFMTSASWLPGQASYLKEYVYLNGKVIATESGPAGSGGTTITITSPSSDESYSTLSSAITLSGSLSGPFDHVAWSDDRGRGNSCSASGSAWTCGSISVPSGDTRFTATAYNSSNAALAADSLNVRYSGGTAPVVTITFPVSRTTNSGIVTMEGTATDDVGITAVKWKASASGKPDRTGDCVPKYAQWAEWRCENINLYEGDNRLYAVAYDVSGNTGTAVFDISYAPPSTPPTPWLQSVHAWDVANPGRNISITWYIPPSFDPSYFAVQRMYLGGIDRNLTTSKKPTNGMVIYEDVLSSSDGFRLGRTYTYRVAACNGGGCGSFSNVSQPVRFRLSSDDDTLTDVAVWTPSSGLWKTLGTKIGLASATWGVSTDKPLLGDYDSDGRTDITIWRPGSGTWYVLKSSAPGTYMAVQWGLSTDVPVPGDYDADGTTDVAVWRPVNGIWYILKSSSPGSYVTTQWGASTDIPLPADYDGDLKTDIAVWRPGTGTWYILPSSSPGTYIATQWGASTDVPVPVDYDGDRKSDLAVWRPGTGIWYILPSANPGTYMSTQWGLPSDTPRPADYDNDGKADPAVWRGSEGIWYYQKSTQSGTYGTFRLGASGDVPLVTVP
jgi:hypothetical protein